MSILSSFSAEEAELIVGLPYRVGIHVSHAEDEDGEDDDEREMRALENTLRAVAKTHEGSAFIQEVVQETLSRRGDWSRWTENVFNVAPECARVVAILKAKVHKDEVTEYKALIVDIASAVAQAYGEFGDGSSGKEGFAGIVKKVVGGFLGTSRDDAGHPMNMSAAESSAIAAIVDALKKAG